MHPDMKPLIDAALADGVITDKERSILHKKALALGVDVDELDMILDGKLHQMKQAEQPSAPEPKAKAAKPDNSTCSACGAAPSPHSLICDYCGTQVAEIASPEDELAAVEQLSAAAQKVAETRPAFNFDGLLYANHEASKEVRVATFWQNCYLPNTLPAASKLLLQIISQINTVPGTAHIDGQPIARANAIYLPRIRAILAGITMNASGDDMPKLMLLKEEVERAERGAAHAADMAKKKMILMWVGTGIFCFVVFGGIGGLFNCS